MPESDGISQLQLDLENGTGAPILPLSAECQFDCTLRFEELMDPTALEAVFYDKFNTSAGKGIDRLNGYQFFASRMVDLVSASQKCLDGTFRFSPYLEVLRPKGRDSKPRVISIPTIRDRVILHQLKTLLAEAFPDCVPRNMAGAIVREIAADLPKLDPQTTFVAGCDIKKFYDTLHHKRLLKHIAERITDPRAKTLVRRAILTPTVPVATRRRDYHKHSPSEGVPQGLSISNVIAAVYVAPIDEGMKKLPVRYYRFVDDVLIYGKEDDVKMAQKSFVARAQRRGLSVHKIGGGKSHITRLTDEFRYLGYVFNRQHVTVRSGTVENLLQSLAAKFSEFRHNKNKRLEKYKYLTLDRLKEIFLLELNERITGAVQQDRRYGWIAYFSQITDLSLLHRLDSVVEGMFARVPEFNNIPPLGLKSFSRAFFEMKYRPHGGYVRDFDAIDTLALKLQFLVQRGRVGPNEEVTDIQIEDRFNRYMRLYRIPSG